MIVNCGGRVGQIMFNGYNLGGVGRHRLHDCRCCKKRTAEWSATSEVPHFAAVCLECWQGLPKSVRAQYARISR